ncbi:MAG: hypothetical protein V9E87_07680 [Gemmatimonadales bacterium]
MFAALLVLPSVAHAQGGPAGNDFAAWADSVATAPTAVALDALRANTQVWDGGQRSLARGWWQLRRGVVTGNANTVEAGIRVLVIERTAQRESPWPAYFLARGFHDLSVLRAPIRSNLAQPEGESNVATFWHLLVPLIDAHPAFAPAARLATDALLALGDRTLRPDELTVLRTLLLREPSNAALMIVEARRLRATGAMPAALARFDAALVHGGDRGVLGLERARTLAALGRVAEGEAAYWEGMAALTPAGREAYRTDLAWFVQPDTLAPFDRVPTDSVPAWLRRFWLERDALAANRPGERLQEQLLRWNDAFRDYHVPLPWRRAQFGRVEYLFEELDLCLNDAGRRLQEDLARLQPSLMGDTRSDEPLLDHRGLIVLRHGLPLRRVRGKPSADTDTTIQMLINRRGANLAPALRAEVMAESMRFNESWALLARWAMAHPHLPRESGAGIPRGDDPHELPATHRCPRPPLWPPTGSSVSVSPMTGPSAADARLQRRGSTAGRALGVIACDAGDRGRRCGSSGSMRSSASPPTAIRRRSTTPGPRRLRSTASGTTRRRERR